MNLCNDGHPEVCFEDSQRKCPACELINEMRELERENEQLKNQIEESKNDR